METKPYNLQSPEQIAKDYGGNKQKIAEAMQMGILDPTAGTLAGMFIDRMRSAQMQEMAPQQTVAQQVFAPPAPPMGAMPPAGLGTTPEAAAMAGAQPQMMAPPPPPPQGMAAGGLTTLPLPDDMFDEPDYGGYASGGLVAFAAGTGPEGVVDPNVPNFEGGEIPVTGPGGEEEEEEERGKVKMRPETPDFYTPSNLYGFSRGLGANMANLAAEAPYLTEEAGQYAKYLRSLLGPEQRAQRRQEDMWTMLGQIGARMASTPGSLLQAVGAGVGEAVPNVARSLSERRAEERGVRQALLGEERTGNQERNARVAIGLQMMERYGGFAEAMKNRAFEDWFRSLDRSLQRELKQLEAATSRYTANRAAESSMFGSQRQYDASIFGTEAQRGVARATAFAEATQPGSAFGTHLATLNPEQRAEAERQWFASYDRGFGGTTGGVPPLPPGFVQNTGNPTNP
jgi:hypothetical protein